MGDPTSHSERFGQVHHEKISVVLWCETLGSALGDGATRKTKNASFSRLPNAWNTSEYRRTKLSDFDGIFSPMSYTQRRCATTCSNIRAARIEFDCENGPSKPVKIIQLHWFYNIRRIFAVFKLRWILDAMLMPT